MANNARNHRLLAYFARRIRDRNEGCMESVCMFVDGMDSKVFHVGDIPQYSDPMFSGRHMSDELRCLSVNSPDGIIRIMTDLCCGSWSDAGQLSSHDHLERIAKYLHVSGSGKRFRLYGDLGSAFSPYLERPIASAHHDEKLPTSALVYNHSMTALRISAQHAVGKPSARAG